jgi:hypothetical protein
MQRWFPLVLCATLGSPALAEEAVYLCRQDGKIVYTASPAGDDCRLVTLKVPQPSQEELDRLAREKERQEAEWKAAAERELQERQVRAQEEAARAAKRQARAAEKQAEYEREQLRLQEETYKMDPYRQPGILLLPRQVIPPPPPPSPPEPPPPPPKSKAINSTP